jgi:HD-GYP domain-containing protein (c-di-GMP phosphodiesterase class II)
VPILAKPGALADSEQAYVRRHVERGLELVAGGALPDRALEMIAGHHERSDGSGYPHQLRGTAIPLFARMAAIADAYDAMTLNRRYAAAMSPYAALRQLDGLREEKFDAALVTELIHALGVYPSGTLVELADGRVGLVCGQQPGHPLQPDVLVTHDTSRQPLPDAVVVATAGATDIFRTLPPNAVRIDRARLEPALERGRHAAA